MAAHAGAPSKGRVEATELLLHPTGVTLPMIWQRYADLTNEDNALRAVVDEVGLTISDMWMGVAHPDGLMRYESY